MGKTPAVAATGSVGPASESPAEKGPMDAIGGIGAADKVHTGRQLPASEGPVAAPAAGRGAGVPTRGAGTWDTTPYIVPRSGKQGGGKAGGGGEGRRDELAVFPRSRSAAK